MRPITTLLRTLFVFSLLTAIASAIGAFVMKARLRSSADPAADDVDVVAIYSGSDFVSTATALRRARLTAWYGGGTLDLRGATLDPAGATLTIRAIFGGCRLVVPETSRVELSSIGIFGAVSDTRAKDRVELDRPALTIDGIAIFGGVGIVSEAPDLDHPGEALAYEAPLEDLAGAPAPA